jgi:hypothetical protein
MRVNCAIANAYAPQLLQAPGADVAKSRHFQAVCQFIQVPDLPRIMPWRAWIRRETFWNRYLQ